jgi:hypothetical protein
MCLGLGARMPTHTRPALCMHRSRVAHVQFLAMFQEQLLDLKRVQAWLAKRDAAASSAAVSASMDATPWDESATGSLLEVGVRACVHACECVCMCFRHADPHAMLC